MRRVFASWTFTAGASRALGVRGSSVWSGSVRYCLGATTWPRTGSPRATGTPSAR